MAVKKLNSFLSLVEKDERYQRLKADLEGGVFAKYKFDEKAKRLRQIHNEKDIKSLTVKNFHEGIYSHTLVKMALQISQLRSDAATIKHQMYTLQVNLQSHLDLIEEYLSITYALALGRDYSTAAERKGALRFLLEDGYKQLAKVKGHLALAEEVVKDLDQNYWTLKLISDTLNSKPYKEGV